MDGNEPLILSDADETFCGVDEGVRVFQYTVKGVLQAREVSIQSNPSFYIK